MPNHWFAPARHSACTGALSCTHSQLRSGACHKQSEVGTSWAQTQHQVRAAAVTSGAVSRMTLSACTMAEAKRRSGSRSRMLARAQKTFWGPSSRDSLRSMREPLRCSSRPPSGPRNLHATTTAATHLSLCSWFVLQLPQVQVCSSNGCGRQWGGVNAAKSLRSYIHYRKQSSTRVVLGYSCIACVGTEHSEPATRLQ